MACYYWFFAIILLLVHFSHSDPLDGLGRNRRQEENDEDLLLDDEAESDFDSGTNAENSEAFLLDSEDENTSNFAEQSDDQRHYKGDRVYRIVPEDDKQLEVLRELLDSPAAEFDFWSQPSFVGNPVDVHVSTFSIHMFERVLRDAGIPYTVEVADVQKVIEDVEFENSKRVKTPDQVVGTFPSHDATNKWLQSLCNSNQKLATCGNVGRSHEKRMIKYIKLGKKSLKTKEKIWLEGTMHAREWITTATIIYIIDRFLTTYGTDRIATRMLNNFDWYIIPISNPDGYEYSRRKERLWRKNRSKVSAKCFGVDLNRNWAYKWGMRGASKEPCANTYRGSKAFSEVETRRLSNFILANKENSLAYFSIHSYGHYWLLPYGLPPKPDDFDELLRVANVGVKALQAVNGMKWRAGNTVELLYAASGGSHDWTKAMAGIDYTYCLELRPINGTKKGFIVAETEIEPSGREVWAGLTTAIDAIPYY